MKTISVIACLLFLISGTAYTQSDQKVFVFGGYAYGRAIQADINLHGFDAKAGVNLTDWIALVGDFSGGYAGLNEVIDIDASLYFAGTGPEFHSGDTARVFAHVFVGAAFAGIDAGGIGVSNTVFATVVGGGVDIGITERIAIRAAQVDWMHGFGDNGGGIILRVSTGVVARF